MIKKRELKFKDVFLGLIKSIFWILPILLGILLLMNVVSYVAVNLHSLVFLDFGNLQSLRIFPITYFKVSLGFVWGIIILVVFLLLIH
ncbi:MAG: hypothetical protein KKA64_04280, partial [Nanoarchaeota archaeon]|nr:hypothetical protein [Nanoarchaeota archaeon]